SGDCTPPHLPSLPTRRSSDLLRSPAALAFEISAAFHFNIHPFSFEIRRRLQLDILAAFDDNSVGRHLNAVIILIANDYFLLILIDRKSTRLNSSHVKISYAVS